MAPENHQNQVLNEKGGGGEERQREKVGKEGMSRLREEAGGEGGREKTSMGKGKEAPPLRRSTIQTLQCKSLIHLPLYHLLLPLPITHFQHTNLC